MALADSFDQDDAFDVIDELGEQIVYVQQRGQEVVRRPISALVRRKPSRVDRNTNGNDSFKRRPIRIEVVNNSTRGIATSEIDTGVDRIELQRIAGDPQSFCSLTLHEATDGERTVSSPNFSVYELY